MVTKDHLGELGLGGLLFQLSARLVARVSESCADRNHLKISQRWGFGRVKTYCRTGVSFAGFSSLGAFADDVTTISG